ncbi:MAG: DUF302 domain-containing protein [Candidatus Dormibacteraeota bacterium]|nr:DUF302 domain-containing protein [Candidatus Dormibacteraeota bacterium]
MEPDDAEGRVRELLKEEGFGVLTEIDVKKTMREKLGVDFRAYRILGACNPPLAHRALEAEPEIGLLLPCNIVVEAGPKGGTRVSFMDAGAVLGMVRNEALAPVGAEVMQRLHRVADRLTA